MKQQNLTPLSPFQTFVRVLIVIFISEAVVMLLISTVSHAEWGLTVGIMDALILTVIVSPFLWWFIVRPMHERTEEVLTSSEERYRLLFESNPHPMWVYDLGTLKFLDVNNTAISHYGYSRDEFLDMTIKDIHPPEDIPALLDNISRVTRGLDKAGVWRHKKKDGTTIYVEIISHTIEWGGRPSEVVLATDITELRQLETELQESESKFRSLVEKSLVGVYLIQDGRFVYVNPKLAETLGCAQSEIISRSPLYFTIEEDHALVIENIRKRIQGEVESVNYTVRAKRKDGTVIDIEAYGTRIDYKGKPAIVGTAIDITERKRAERLMAAEHAITRILSESANLQEVGQKILKIICEGLGWDFGEIWDTDKQNNILRCAGIWHPPSVEFQEFEAITRDITFMLGVGLPGRVWASGKPAWIPDVVHDANFPRAVFAERAGLHGAFAFPIVLEGEVLGVMGFFSKELREPEDDLLQMFSSIGGQIGQFIKRKSRERELEIVDIVNKALRGASNRTEIFQILLNQLNGLLVVEGASIGLVDISGDEILFEVGSREWENWTGKKLSLNTGISRRVVETGQPYLDNQVEYDPGIPEHDLIGNLCAVACVPLITRGRTIGMLCIGRKTSIRDDELHLLTIICDIAATAIQRTTLHEQTKRQLKRITALREIDMAITASLDLHITLNILLNNVISRLGVDASDVLIFNPYTSTLEYAAGQGFRSDAISHSQLRIGEGYAGKCARERRLIAIPDISESEKSPSRAKLLKGEGFITYYAIPPYIQGSTEGCPGDILSHPFPS